MAEAVAVEVALAVAELVGGTVAVALPEVEREAADKPDALALAVAGAVAVPVGDPLGSAVSVALGVALKEARALALGEGVAEAVAEALAVALAPPLGVPCADVESAGLSEELGLRTVPVAAGEAVADAQELPLAEAQPL